MSTTKTILKELKSLRKSASKNDMLSAVEEIDDIIIELESKLANIDSTISPEELLHNQMQQMTDDICRAINSMSSIDISLDNNKYYFKRYPELHAAADISVRILESSGKDSRDLSIAFGDFIYRRRVPNNELDAQRDDISKNGHYVIDVPLDRIMAAMSWMEWLAEKKSPKWVKSNCVIPKKAMESRESFEAFVKKFSKKHGIFYPE